MKNIIIGGAGFIGSNLANRLLEKKQEVVVADDLSRSGSEKNLGWLNSKFPRKLSFLKIDITKNPEKLKESLKSADRVFHLAAQVAVTTSVEKPRRDFEINALGTFNVLETIRKYGSKNLSLLYSSTNKVYGGMDEVKIMEKANAYAYKDFPNGIPENQPLDFHSPYGCSKGSGDQYVRDYFRIYGMKTIVFRQSCIYGPRQFGIEDQGWVAWFIIALLTNKKITIFGDGKQVRDVLFVDDLLDAFEKATENINKTQGEVFNIGGGKDNTISIWKDFKVILESLSKKKLLARQADWRPGDQKIYISDIRKAQRSFGWKPKTPPQQGIEKLYNWVLENLNLFK
ncbi:MAG: GDP-mannose 4,6-dehydratase [Patescibacteria group bacterium]